jgi:hypothetical protein
VDAQTVVDTLAALSRAIARMEEAQAAAVAAVEAAATRAEAAAERAATSADAVTGTARAALTGRASLQAEVQTIDRAARALDAAQGRLAEVPVPAWRWLLGSAAAGAVLAVALEAAAWPALAPWLTPAPVIVTAAPAVQAQPREPERPRREQRR